ncbi:DUF5710 domain-containing protein [Streptomyces sp. NPDC096198]|uniref:DUF5710 domain-containing protein n=1 Tax=Streptomyces sp. NPDC096198 TaxID=3366080 RepID=UPI0037F7E43C
MGRAGRLRKPELTGSHAELNTALHALHKGAGLISLSAMVRALEGAGISRSTIYDAFSSRRLPSWDVVDALVEVLATKHPQMAPEEVQPRFHRLWLSAVDEEPYAAPAPDQEASESQWFSAPSPDSPWFVAPAQVHYDPSYEVVLESVIAETQDYDGKRVWLNVPAKDRAAAKTLGALWDATAKRWYAVDPSPDLIRWRPDGE